MKSVPGRPGGAGGPPTGPPPPASGAKPPTSTGPSKAEIAAKQQAEL